MVFQKRSSSEMESCGGSQVAEMPRVPKSAKGKRSIRKKEAQSQGQMMCAFDLLATVAGKLLDEGEGSLGNMSAGAPALAARAKDVRVKQEQYDDEVKHLKHEVTDQDSCNESAILPHIALQRPVNHARNENPKAKSEAQDKESSMISCTKAALGCNFGAIADRWSTESVESGAFTGDAVASVMPMAAAGFHKMAPDMYNLLVPMDVDVKPPPLVSSDSTGEMPLYGDKVHRSISFPRGQKGTTGYAVDRNDDDDKSSGCTHPSITTNRGFRPNCIVEHSRVKKLLTCKYRKVAASRLHRDLSYSDVERKPSFRNKKMHYTRQRTQRSTFKRRKLFDCHSVIASEEFGRTNGKGNAKATTRDSHAASFKANKGTNSMPFQKSCESNDCHVKLRIKSFKVPELLIEIPETATVGLLKKTVLEAMNAVLGGGLRVGVLHHGKKIRDDSKTLMQAGIGHDDMLDNLGFSLEPNCTQNPLQVPAPEDTSFLETIDTTEPLARIAPADSSSKHGEVDASQELELTPLAANYQGSDHDSVHSPGGISSPDNVSTNLRAIVPVPPADPNAGAVVPANKSKRSPEQGQRRIRRPFSVTEVEALVLAVEKLGTGRWRDVKLRAFDNAKHRTYVDLKDKWKTLVHTASISPQQRRGEPVPQELLDRVLAAQAYWSQQQAKLQPKTPPLAEACVLT
ncbi:telomere repeat-binding protein 5-like [Phragmites australis]|uniref:telomere repeat-binding protein 5-like n=1 Tax=Phragmites australis TaxID=29695 RepID=UPI002D77E734|nr:telomere repeat-binding protein 5-like [Phragmites australis]